MLDQLQQLLINFSVSESAVVSIYADILLRYTESGRHYHTLSHIQEVLDTAAQLQPLARDYPAIQLAAWFHDIIYNTRTPDNEVQSAVYTESVLSDHAVPPETIQRVSQMIMATAQHTNPAQEPDTYILLDADLAILGRDEARFAQYCQDIRREYEWVAEPDYRAGRVKVLRRFLERPRLYHTPLLYEQLEKQARENLKAEIGRLE